MRYMNIKDSVRSYQNAKMLKSQMNCTHGPVCKGGKVRVFCIDAPHGRNLGSTFRLLAFSLCFCLFVSFDALLPSQQCFINVGTGLHGFNQHQANINVPCLSTQHSDAGEARTCGPSVSSLLAILIPFSVWTIVTIHHFPTKFAGSNDSFMGKNFQEHF